MPTGYTAKIYDGEELDLTSYIRRVSTAFFIEYRDNGKSHLERTEREGNYISQIMYYSEKLDRAEEKFDYFKSLKIVELDKMYRDYINKTLNDYKINQANVKLHQDNYNKVLNELNKWNPESEVGKNIKEFAKKQLEDSIEFDIYEVRVPKRYTYSEWVNNEMANLKNEIKYNESEFNQAVKNNNLNKKMLDDLWNDIDGIKK